MMNTNRTVGLVLFFLIFSGNIYAHGDASWRLRPGNSYYIMDQPVNVRSAPNLNGTVIAQLKLHEKIKVIKNTENEQEINSIWAYWYEIEFRDREIGYVWGGYIAAEALVFDIDGNGVNDYIYYRVSDTDKIFWVIDAWKDVVIYINDKKILTTGIQKDENHTWEVCSIREGINTAYLLFESTKHSRRSTDIFSISKDGNIRHELYFFERFLEL